MKSKKSINRFSVSIDTFKNFKVPREILKTYRRGYRDGTYTYPSAVKILKHANKKRARRLDYNLVMGFE